MVHHAVFCLMAAFASRRMLVIDKTEEIFGLEKHFLPSQSKSLKHIENSIQETRVQFCWSL